jgi:hypothetical protein
MCSAYIIRAIPEGRRPQTHRREDLRQDIFPEPFLAPHVMGITGK